MIVQCHACQTRFRLADEKVKPGGTRVRCSKCKEIFVVMPPEAEPEPAEEAVDFGAFNMQAVSEEDRTETPASGSAADQAVDSASQETSDDVFAYNPFATDDDSPQEQTSERADDAPSADTGAFAADDLDATEDRVSESSDTTNQESVEDDFAVVDESDNELTFEFSSFDPEEDAEDETEEATAFDSFATDEPEDASDETAAFDFTDEPTDETEEQTAAEFAFESDEGFAFETEEDSAPAASTAEEEEDQTADFDFSDQDPFAEAAPEGWGEESSTGDTFEFDESAFETDASATTPSQSQGEDDNLKFGEIAFAESASDDELAGLHEDDEPADDDDFAFQDDVATLDVPETPQQASHARQEQPQPVPAQPKKSSLSRILLVLILLLVGLGGAAGYLFMQEGTLNLNQLRQYLPFLQEYIGAPEETRPGDHIAINISGSFYVDGKAGQMLAIQGEAVNNYPGRRSSITIKGVLLDAQDNPLLQQTVFCGNPLTEEKLRSMSFTAIEEAMNNEFGDSLSNMNVAAGASIPFTIVFRNPPAGIANINVEVVDSKPGAN
ncbi:MAG: DUF3426 domain-containing protein [Desulfuromonadales bacterium]|jgi:predicted Zn finger-like uncharacterized protein